MLNVGVNTSAVPRILFVDALRAAVATMIVWHHFALYGPLAFQTAPSSNPLMDWLRDYRWPVQVFFIISGYVLARSMSRRTWNCRQVGWFVVRRYCRLGLPYLAAVALAIGVCALGRPWISQNVVGHPPTWQQVLAHTVFLQDILGYDSLSAGLWFVAIEFQLGLIYVAMLYVRDALAPLLGGKPGTDSTNLAIFLGWMLAVPSLFFFNVDERFDVWAIYFFGQFLMGVMVYHALQGPTRPLLFWLYSLAVVAALIYCWRWRLATALAAGLGLFAAGKLGLMERWPASRLVQYLGIRSYSLFLVHFAVFVLVVTLWLQFDATSDWNPGIALGVAYLSSLAAAGAFYRVIEAPASRLSRKFS